MILVHVRVHIESQSLKSLVQNFQKPLHFLSINNERIMTSLCFSVVEFNSRRSQFNSESENIPRFYTQSPVGSLQEAADQ